MAEDATIEDFLGTEETAGDADGDPAGSDRAPAAGSGTERGEATTEVAGAEGSVRSTFSWSPDGAACAECGAVVERRWRDERGLVCDDCKDW